MAAIVIPCIFNRGCSAAKFLFVPRARVDIHTPPLPAVEGRGGSGGGGTILACPPPLHTLKNKRIEALMALFATKKATEHLYDELGALALRVVRLETANKQLGLEWEELYDKVRHQMARMSRRVKRDEKDDLNGPEPEIPAEDYPGVDPISARILRLRNPGGPRG